MEDMSHIIVGRSCGVHNLDVNERERAGSIKFMNDQIRGFGEEGTFASAKRSRLPMVCLGCRESAVDVLLCSAGAADLVVQLPERALVLCASGPYRDLPGLATSAI